jgi:hypothetical protein
MRVRALQKGLTLALPLSAAGAPMIDAWLSLTLIFWLSILWFGEKFLPNSSHTFLSAPINMEKKNATS